MGATVGGDEREEGVEETRQNPRQKFVGIAIAPA